MTGQRLIPELAALTQADSMVRIPDQLDVPLSPRVKRLLDTAAFRRMAAVRQLGFVALVYPGAVHHRLEHSLGVYRNALLFLRQLLSSPELDDLATEAWCDAVILAALVHDIGHYPFCHPIEDLDLPQVLSHETLARRHLESPELAACLREDWRCDLELVMRLLTNRPQTAMERLAKTLLSGPIDVDKLDYLFRDSLHAGVPYGRNFDAPRLISSLCLNRRRDGIAISTKGRTAAELMVFARYVMFSEVYWHHAVRSATAMFQRLIFSLREELPFEKLYASQEATFPDLLQRHAVGEPWLLELFLDLFGPRRLLYKRWGQFNCFTAPERFQQIARNPFPWLVQLSERLAENVSAKLGEAIPATYVLVDAPPTGLEVQFEIDVWERKTDTFYSLGELSPVVKALAERQFDDYVKQIRIFLHPMLLPRVDGLDLEGMLSEAVSQMKEQ